MINGKLPFVNNRLIKDLSGFLRENFPPINIGSVKGKYSPVNSFY